MAISFPLNSTFFWRVLPIAVEQFQFMLPDTRRVTRTVGGEILTSDGAARLWQGSVVLSEMTLAKARFVRAMISALTESQGSFFAHDVRNEFPMADPGGAVLGASTPVINALNVNGTEMRVSGLPAGYVLSEGDMIGWTYGSPAKTALHRIVTPATAGVGGITGEFQVVPAIRPGAAPGSAVRLGRASIKAVIDPASIREGGSNMFNQSGISFSFIQSLR